MCDPGSRSPDRWVLVLLILAILFVGTGTAVLFYGWAL